VQDFDLWFLGFGAGPLSPRGYVQTIGPEPQSKT